MGIGDFAVGFAAKRAAPRVSLGLLLLSGMFVNLLWVVWGWACGTRYRPRSWSRGRSSLAGVAVYARATRGRDRIGTWGPAALVGLFLVIHVASYVGPPPPSLNAVVVATPPLALTLAAAHVIDGHRDVR